MAWWARGCVPGPCGAPASNSAGARVRAEPSQKARMLGVGHPGEGRGQQRAGGEVGLLWHPPQCGRGAAGCFPTTEASPTGEGWGRSFPEGQGSAGLHDPVLQLTLKSAQGDAA